MQQYYFAPSPNYLFLQQNNLYPANSYGLTSQEVVDTIDFSSNFGQWCNYDIQPLRRRVFIDRFGVRKEEELICWIRIEGGVSENFSIKAEEIKRLTTVIGDRYTMATIYCDAKKAEKKIEARFRELTNGLPVERIYVDAGWQLIDGKIVYGHDNLTLYEGASFQTGLSLPSYQVGIHDAAEIFYDALNLYREPTPFYTMIAFSMLGVLYKPFEMSLHAPRSVLFVNGKTGSMKTTLSKIIYTQVTDASHRDTPRCINMDTGASFERGIVEKGRDTVTLFDDFASPKTSGQKTTSTNNLESIIRMFGGGVTKSRSNSNLQDCRGDGVKGVGVVTGELIGKGKSLNFDAFFVTSELKM